MKRQCQVCGSPTAIKAIEFTEKADRKQLWVCDACIKQTYSELEKLQSQNEFDLAIVDFE